MRSSNRMALWMLSIVASVSLSACASKTEIVYLPTSPQPLPMPSVDMPRPPLDILKDVEQTLSDLDRRQSEARSLLTPSGEPSKTETPK